ncbi:MAG: biopolymer transporter ExbB [Pseudomonadota bacterium]
MSLDEGRGQAFSMPTRQIAMMLIVLALVVIGGTFLAAQIQTVFAANVYLNAFIGFVFLIGIFATFWQVAQIIAAVRWLKNLQAGFKGHEFTDPPRLVASMAPLLREGKMKKRMAASSTRSILDSIAVRLDEARDITRYITNLLIFLGLLGTFWGLSLTVPAVVDTIRSLAPQPGDTQSDVGVFDRLMGGLESQLGGMGTAFASSLVGLAGSLVVGLLELFAGHGQNRFYRELEDWLTSFTRLGLVNEGEGPDGALVALLERVDEGLEKTTDFATKAEAARIKSEERLGAVADVIGTMANEMQTERQIVQELVNEIRSSKDVESGRDHATLTVLKRMEQTSLATAEATAHMADTLQRGGGTQGSRFGDEVGLKNVEAQLRLLADDISVGRHEATAALRAELRTLINLIDQRTRDGGGT